MPEETPGTGLSPGKVICPCRHFDQVKRVEKSPKAKQYYPCKIPNLTVIQSIAKNLLERLSPKAKQYYPIFFQEKTIFTYIPHYVYYSFFSISCILL